MATDSAELSPLAQTSARERHAARSDGKRARLLKIAREQFVSNGYRAATMDSIALAAGISKRTLYLWHADKAALFRACMMEGAERFPLLVLEDRNLQDTLEQFARSLIEEFSSPPTVAMGRLLMREQHEFPELLPAAERTRDTCLVRPLAARLAEHGLERMGSTERARLFLSMALAPVHDHLLLGLALPSRAMIDRHVALVVRTFLSGAESSS